MQEKPNTNNRKTGRTNQRNYNRSKNSVTKKTINRNNIDTKVFALGGLNDYSWS